MSTSAMCLSPDSSWRTNSCHSFGKQFFQLRCHCVSVSHHLSAQGFSGRCAQYLLLFVPHLAVTGCEHPGQSPFSLGAASTRSSLTKAKRKLPPVDSGCKVVRVVGIEPTRLAALDFESSASTSSTTPASILR